MKPLTSFKNEEVTLRIKNHGALAAVVQGKADTNDIDTLIAALNMSEAFSKIGYGGEYKAEIQSGQDALRDLGSRGLHNGSRYICKAGEITSINLAMEIHDAQLDVVTVKDMEVALELVKRTLRSGNVRRIA